jgi:hypothetical protein
MGPTGILIRRYNMLHSDDVKYTYDYVTYYPDQEIGPKEIDGEVMVICSPSSPDEGAIAETYGLPLNVAIPNHTLEDPEYDEEVSWDGDNRACVTSSIVMIINGTQYDLMVDTILQAETSDLHEDLITNPIRYITEVRVYLPKSLSK